MSSDPTSHGKEGHDSAHLHVSGRSEFVDDRRLEHGEVHVGLVLSTQAHAQILNINATALTNDPDILAFFSAADLAHNAWGPIFEDQPLLAEDEVRYVGEPILIVAATNREALIRAQHLVAIEYQDRPAILSISEARRQQSFIGEARTIERGNCAEVWKRPLHKLEGCLIIRGADHFYLENQASVVYPREDGQLEVHSSTQHPTETQHVVAHALGLSAKDVVCVVKRLGGAFGGKESQAAPFAAYAALVAQRLNRPARLVLSKDEDMLITGKRNPFENEYRVGFDRDGKIHVLEVDMYSDGGAYADLSTAIMERAMLHIDNAYFLGNLRVSGQVCRTNFHPHTAFRGFGGPKGVATIERIIEEIAAHLKMDPYEVRLRNCYRDVDGANVTHYGQVVENNCLPKLFEQLAARCNYHQRRKGIEARNQQVLADDLTHPLSGISLTAVKFGIAFTTRFLNQANALVHVHRDGTIQVSTGATEMGQGVNARIAKLVAQEFSIARSSVRVMPTATDKNANTAPTAASSGTDLNGAATLLACQKIRKRLGDLAAGLLHIPEELWPSRTAGLGTEEEFEAVERGEEKVTFENDWVFLKDQPKKRLSFTQLADEAFLSRISLSELVHFKTPGLGFNKLTGQGQAFLYFTQGTAVSEVTVSPLTGEVKVQRVDILMDLGRPIVESLDRGQVTGGFVQGMGWVTSENLHYSDQGRLLTISPSTYKIPNMQDTPRIFNVDLLENLGNHVNIKGTKAVGEPPLLLALSVWTAIHDALRVLPHFQKSYPRLPIPAAPEQVLRAIHPQLFAQWEGR